MRSGTTALFDAAYLGHPHFVRKLLEMKADPYIEDADGSNAVYAPAPLSLIPVLCNI